MSDTITTPAPHTKRLFLDCLSRVEKTAGLRQGVASYGPPLFSETRTFEEGRFDVVSDEGRVLLGIVYQNLVEAGRSLYLLEGKLYDRPDWLFEAHRHLGIGASVARALMDPDHPPFLFDAYGMEEVHKRLVAALETLSDKWPAIEEAMKRPEPPQEELANV